MMKNVRNTTQLIGNLGANPEIITTTSGKKLAKFSIATHDSYKNSKGERIHNTQWHNVVAWEGVATIVEKFLTKGKEVVLEGKLVHRSYEDGDGVIRYVTEVLVNEILLLGSKE